MVILGFICLSLSAVSELSKIFQDKNLSNGIFFLELLSAVEPRVVNWNLVTKGESGTFAYIAHLIQENYRVLMIQNKYRVLIRGATDCIKPKHGLFILGLNLSWVQLSMSVEPGFDL